MKATVAVMLFVLSLGVFWLGCDTMKHPTEVSTGTSPSRHDRSGSTNSQVATVIGVPLPQSVTLLGFTVYFDGRTEANNQTTFFYHVVGPGVKSHFTLETPLCAGPLAAYSPTTSANFNIDPNVGISGIEWQLSNGATDTSSHYYSITFSGSVRMGIIETAVKSNDQSQKGLIAGPCARVFDISGAVFADANSNGSKEPTETGIAGVRVDLLDGSSTLLGSASSNSFGQYLFETLPAGNYFVKVDTNTVTSSTKTKYLSTTTPLSISVTVGPNSANNNFGFDPRTTLLIDDIKFGTLPTNGKSAGYWKKQFQAALGNGKADYTAAALLALLDQVSQLQLNGPTDPFTFPNGLATAFDILNNPTKTDADALRKQLLATELNHVTGRGIISTDPGLQLLLIGWGEAILVTSGGAVATMSIKEAPRYNSVTATAKDATDVFSTINSGGGGGSF
ncbi:MAG: hypothetical protein HYR77_03520 [Ignavibacteria bacterium]|nr:hypothetical protein [Ignavibacteria bacterium]